MNKARAVLWLRRPIRSLTTWPCRQDWVACGVAAAVAIFVIAAVGLAMGMLHYRPDLSRWSLLVFVIPAFSEELLFRGVLPSQGETQRPVLWLTGGVAVFTLWHVVEALTFLPRAGLFLTPAFLLCAGMMGAACAWMRYRTDSLWPGVLFHGLIVMAWQVLFNGPAIADLR